MSLLEGGRILQLNVSSGPAGDGENRLPGPAVKQRQGQPRDNAVGLLHVPPAVGRIIIDDVQPGIVDPLETPAELPIDLETGQAARSQAAV